MARTISSAINGTLALVTADNPLTIANSGSVTATASGADAIDGGSGTSWSITNNGGIASSLGYGVFLNGTGSSISNSGSISGQGAVHLVSGASVTNTSGGTIKATGTSGFSSIAGVQISGSGTVNNAGMISAAGTGYGVSLDNGGTVTNGGSITGGEDGVVISGAGGQLINTGKITATVDDGVSVVGSVVNGVGGSISALSSGGFGPAAIYTPTGIGNVQNDGSISGAKYGVYFSAGGSVTNGANSASASISGGSYGIFVTGGSGTVTNAGTISGGSYAVYFSSNSASNKMVVEPGAVFNGAVSGGQGTLELASGLGSISGISSSGSFRSFQSLSIDAGGAWTLNGANNSVASVTNNGTLVVTGSCKISTAIDSSSSGQFQLGVAGASCTLEVASETGSRSQANFVGNGKLIIDNAGTFGANVGTSSYTGPLLESFAAGDTIQILNFSASGATISFDGSTGLAQISNATQKATLDFQTSTLASGGLQVASDGGTGIYVTLSPAPGPRLSSLATSGTGISSGNGDLNAGKVVTLTVNFSGAVTVNTAGGTPTLSLNDGGTATYTAGSGTSALAFSYTVAAGQNTPDLVVSSFNLNGATVKDAAGNAADLSGASNNNPTGTLQIDTLTPSVNSIATSGPGITNGSGNLSTGQVVTLTVNMSEVVIVDTTGGTPTLSLNDGGTATYTAGSGTSALAFSYTVAAGQNTPDLVVSSFNLNGATVKDGAGNAADLSGASNYNPPGTLQIGGSPALTVASIATSGTGIASGSGDLNAGKVVTLTVNFSGAVTVNTAGGTPTLSLNDGGTATYTAGSGTSALTFSYTVAAGQNAPDLVVSSFNLNGATVKDAAGNAADLSGASNYNPAGTLQIDTIAPLPVFSQEPPPVTNSNAAAFAFATSNNETSGVSYAYKLDTATTWSPVTGNALSLSGLATGSHTIQVQATDAAGNVSSAASYNWTITASVAVAQIEKQFSGPSVTSAYPPHNGFAVGPNNVVMMDGSRIEWTNLAGGSPTLQSVYNFFSPLGSTAANSLNHPRCAYDSVNQRYIVIMDNSASNRAISNIDIAVSKDSNPNDGWYFASLNTSLTINSQLTSADSPTLSVDGTNIYIAATMYNVNVSGSPGTESWVIGDTAGAGGGIYSGGTLTVTASQFMPANNGTFAVATGGSGKTYYASSYSSGSQIVVTLQAYDAASNTFGPISTIGLGNIDQGGSYTAQQLGTSLLLDAGDKQARSLVYANGFLYGVTEIKPIGSSVPEVHWFKIDVSNPNAPTLAAQGDISGAAIGTNVATFNGSIALDASGDVIINFTASGPNMYPGDYYVYQRGSDPAGSFSAPALYQASTGFFDSGNGASVQPWGRYSTATVDPNNPNSFWISNEYVDNGWWQTAVASVAIETAEVPTLTIANTALTVTAGGSVPLGITATPVDSDDAISLQISGVPTYETITASSGITVTSSLQADGTNTWTVTEGAATTGAPLTGLTLSSSYTGSDHPIATFKVTATNTTPGETATSAAQTITVTDPPAVTSGVQPSTSPGGAIAASTSDPGQIDRLVALLDQFTAAGFHEDRTGAGAVTSTFGLNQRHEDLASLAMPRFHHASAH